MPRRKDYDETEMVRLIARGELTHEQIAERLGLSPHFIHEVATGRKRRDLLPKIYQAMREFIGEAWKNGGVLPTEDGRPRPRPTSGRSKQYDDNLAVELLGAGELTYGQIAEQLGLTREMVWQIATGRARPDLQPRIREAEQRYRERARRIGAKWADKIVMKQIKVALTDDGSIGLRARQDLMDRFLGRVGQPVAEPPGPADWELGPDLRDLPEPLKTEVIRALGGPEL